MELRQYLIDTFKYNDRANRQVLESIGNLSEKDQCIKFFSHMINSQKKWMARIVEYPNNPQMSWWDPVYPFEKLEEEWGKSLKVFSKTQGHCFAVELPQHSPSRANSRSDPRAGYGCTFRRLHRHRLQET